MVRQYSKQHDPSPKEPQTGTTWYEAAAYCRWLNEQEGIPENQMCYPPVPEIKHDMRLPKDYLKRTGYRLPTDAEWEYACRAGTRTSRYFGDSPTLLPAYAHYIATSDYRPGKVGQCKPNDLGLFDMLGNVGEWCDDLWTDTPNVGAKREVDVADNAALTISGEALRVTRNSCYDAPPRLVRCARRSGHVPTYRSYLHGFRLARTVE